MKRMIDKLLINEILRHAPHRKVVRVFPIFTKTVQVQQKMMEYADDIYLDGFISDVFEHQELNYETNMGPINSPFRFQHHQKNTKANNKRFRERQQIEERLLLTIKILNQQKNSFLSYTEANQNIVMMTAEEAQKYKKYLVYIYKLLSNLRQITNKDKQNMINDLKDIIVKKICEGHQNGEQQKKVKNQLEIMNKVVDKQRIMAEKKEKESIAKVKKIYEREAEKIKNKNKSEE